MWEEEVVAMRAPVILDVNPDPGELDWEQHWLGDLGLPVVTCEGPHGPRDCPLLRGERCGKVEKADGILFQLDLDRTDHREILTAYTQTLDVPIRAVVTPEQAERYADLLKEVEVFTPPIGPSALDAFASEVESDID